MEITLRIGKRTIIIGSIVIGLVLLAGCCWGVYSWGKNQGYTQGYQVSNKEWQAKYAIDQPKWYSDGHNAGYQDCETKWQEKYKIDQPKWYQDGYQKGDSEGYNRGYSQGKSDGYNQGFSEGRRIGCQECWQVGSNAVWDCWYQWYSQNKQPDWTNPPSCPRWPYYWDP